MLEEKNIEDIDISSLKNGEMYTISTVYGKDANPMEQTVPGSSIKSHMNNGQQSSVRIISIKLPVPKVEMIKRIKL